jgi:thioredoxin-like negative regulator of GroEL|eukprot:CAMPEP_0169149822 /NCGR_PEP_ID=MMETSP1015-20121227/49777_1 /TAXON_ID=342587 /ORGANISM="Karlodinium micrum, Strain CCMP2283" /LENGTH=392 /DNA_ID=CAMNT_0009218759 /DNA_START=138 /DNA_END=1316 /DNA_ORIENTATION=+
MEHDIQQITEKNFDGVIGKFRADSVAALWFFKDDNSEDEKFLTEYNKVAKELKGMVKITALNCNQWAKFCSKNNVKQTPAVMMYPTFPAPAFLYEGKMETKIVAGKLAKMIPDLSTRLTKENVDSWLGADISKPKMIIFSNKKNPPTILKALSSDTVFKRTAKFGFVTEEDAEVCQKFKVTKFPAAILQRKQGNNVKKDTFSGQMNFEELYKWINPYVESGMGDKMAGAGGQEASIEDDQPWLTQEVPELTAKSSNSICFKGEGLCVIYLKDGAASQNEIDMLSGLSKKYSSQNNKAKMKFMWINLAIESAFKELFKADQLPSTVVFNPHKRLRFTKLDHGEDGSIKSDADGISGLIDKVLGGDARFTNVPGQKLPAWVPRETPKKEGKKEL